MMKNSTRSFPIFGLVQNWLPTAFLLSMTVTLGACASDGLSAADEEAMFQTHHDFAFAYYAMGPEAYDRCQQQIYKALEHDDEHVELRVLLGQVLVRKGGLEEIASAELVYRSLLSDDDPRAVLGLALCLERRGNFYDEAARSIASGQRSTEARDPQARAAELAEEAEEHWKDSESYYLRAYEETPDNRAVLNGLQRVKALQKQPKKSLFYSDRLLSVCQAEYGFWKQQIERPDLSARDEDSMRINIADLESLMLRTHFHAANLSVEQEDLHAALEHLAEASALRPNLAEVHSRRAELFKQVGDYTAALFEIEEFLRLSQLPFEHPDVNAAYALKGECEAALKG